MTIPSAIYELRGPRDLALRSESIDPAALGPQDLAARTRVSVISPGTETAAWKGDPPLRPGKVYPRLVGYCNVAEVVAVGKDVTQVKTGDLVYTHQSHRSAFRCPAAEVLVTIPPGTPLAPAATTYLFNLSYNALQKGGYQTGQTVGIIGLGAIGLGAVALAKHLGATVVAYTNQDASAALARSWGATVFRKDEVALQPKSVDLLVSTSGTWADWRLALQQTRKDGTIAVLGFPGRTDAPPPFNPLASEYFYDSQLRIVACGQSSDADLRKNCAWLLDLIRVGSLPAAELLSETVSWKSLSAVYEKLGRRDASRTVALDWSVDAP